MLVLDSKQTASTKGTPMKTPPEASTPVTHEQIEMLRGKFADALRALLDALDMHQAINPNLSLAICCITLHPS